MERLCERELCTGCGACAAVCPADCIRMEEDGEGFLRPVIREERCIGCGRCGRTCPILADTPVPDRGTQAWAAVNTEESIRQESTSGGVFTRLCAWVMDRGGIVFGAAYDDDFHVAHCAVERMEDLHRLRGAKYAQSRLGDTFHRVRECLETGRMVLFSGTPCQVGGLLAFLGRAYENLILVDLICHGVPSPRVWRQYLEYRRGQDAPDDRAAGVNLRSKETGWPGYSVRFDYPQGRFYSAPNFHDPYLRGFVKNLYLRPSCYQCRFKGSVRQSDFTLGDYWGVWDQMPEYHDGKGTSLVLLHTDRAKEIWQAVSGGFRTARAPENALADNPSALTPAPATPLRETFFQRYESEDFTRLVDELCPLPPPPPKPSFLARCKRLVKRILARIGLR